MISLIFRRSIIYEIIELITLDDLLNNIANINKFIINNSIGRREDTGGYFTLE